MKKYYSLKNILNKNADYNIIIGERSNGKTYATLYHILETYIQTKKQGAYIRRWADDIKGKRGEAVFSSLVENDVVSKLTNGEYTTIIYARNSWHIAKWDNDKRRFIADKDPFCFAFSLSEMEHDKSTSYPNITNIVFDEFLTRRYYLPDEFIILMNTLSTIIRDRNDVKIFMLGNTVNKYCPYFDEMGLKNVETMEQGTIDVYTYGDSSLTVALEYCGNTVKKKSNKYFAFNNPRLNMITSGAWELSIYPHLAEGEKIDNKNIIFKYYIVFNHNIVECDIIDTGRDVFTFCHKKTTEIKDPVNSLIYTLDYTTAQNVRKNIFDNSPLNSKVAYFFRINKVFYQTNEIGEIVHNYLINCTRGN